MLVDFAFESNLRPALLHYYTGAMFPTLVSMVLTLGRAFPCGSHQLTFRVGFRHVPIDMRIKANVSCYAFEVAFKPAFPYQDISYHGLGRRVRMLRS